MTDEIEEQTPHYSPEQLQEKIDSGNFWMIECFSQDWLVILKDVIKNHYTDREGKLTGEVLIILGDFSTLIMMEKSKLPVDVLATHLGTEAGALTAANLIKLWPMEEWKPVKTPTVDYAGSA